MGNLCQVYDFKFLVVADLLALVFALQLLPTVVQVSTQYILETAVLQLGHNLADLPALSQPAVNLGRDLRR